MILASRSPQRTAILEQLGIPFTVTPADVEEREQGPPEEVALQNAGRKAQAVAMDALEGGLVLGVDTVVALDGRLYGKPGGEAEARETLGALSGRTHAVVSGICLAGAGAAPRTACATTLVGFREIGPELLTWYLECGEWRGRAGGYAIQGRGAALVASIQGDYLNVVGLPVGALLDLEPRLLAL